MVESNGNERLTAFVSTIVAVAILAAGVTAHQSVPRTTDIGQLEADLQFQFERTFRHDARQGEARLATLEKVMAGWRESAQSDLDREQLVAWMHESAMRSIPGTLAPLPEIPEFSQVQSAPTVQVVEHEVKKVVVDEQPKAKEAESTLADNGGKTKPGLYTQGPQTVITPTLADPLEEEMVALRQPQSINPEIPPATATTKAGTAPRPGMTQESPLRETNLLASVPVEPQEPVGVNLTELAARIAGYHDALDKIDMALMTMKTADMEVITREIAQLESLVRDYRFVDLYYQSLTEAERRMVIAPRPMNTVIAEIERQLDRCEEVLDGDFLGMFDSAAKEEFAKLRLKLSVITERTEF